MAQRSIVPFLYGNSPALRSIPDPRALIERLFGEIPDLTGNTALAAPRIDVSETDREIRVKAELPGVGQNDIEVMVDDDLLTIRGEKKIERDQKRELPCRRARDRGLHADDPSAFPGRSVGGPS